MGSSPICPRQRFTFISNPPPGPLNMVTVMSASPDAALATNFASPMAVGGASDQLVGTSQFGLSWDGGGGSESAPPMVGILPEFALANSWPCGFCCASGLSEGTGAWAVSLKVTDLRNASNSGFCAAMAEASPPNLKNHVTPLWPSTATRMRLVV